MKLSKIETPVRVVLAFNDAFNRHEVDEMMALMSEDCVFENTFPPPDGARYEGRAAVAQFWRDFFAASPSARFETEEIFGLGNRCVVRWRYDWTDASGQSGHVRGVDLFKVQGELISEKLSYVKG